MKNKFDLHVHSTYSDGSLNIKQIVDRAILNKLDVIAITDHDNNESWKEIDTSSFKIPVLKGVEMSTTYMKDSVHILGYYLNNNGDYSELTNRLIDIQEKRKERVVKIISKLEQFDIYIKYEDVIKYADGAVARPHIAKAILEKYTDRGYTFEGLFEQYLGNDKPAYVKIEEFSSKDAIDLLHRNNCIAVLAHPWLISKFDYKEIKPLGIDGIECDIAGNLENSRQYFDFAKKNNLIITAGSDFHGPDILYEIGSNYIEGEYAISFLNKVNKHVE